MTSMRQAPTAEFTLTNTDLDTGIDCAEAVYCEGLWLPASPQVAIASSSYEGPAGIRYRQYGINLVTGMKLWEVDLGPSGRCAGANAAALVCSMGTDEGLRILSVQDGSVLAALEAPTASSARGEFAVRSGEDLMAGIVWQESQNGDDVVLQAVRVDADGHVVWSSDTALRTDEDWENGRSFDRDMVLDDQVLVSGLLTRDGGPVALDIKTGALEAPSRAAAANSDVAQPVVDDGSAPDVLFVWAQGEGLQARPAGSDGAAAPVWTEDASLEALCAGSAVLIDSRTKSISARDAQSGAERWRRQLEDEYPDVMCDGERVILVDSFGMLALDAATGEETWREDPAWSGGQVTAQPATGGGGATALLVSARDGEEQSLTVYQIG